MVFRPRTASKNVKPLIVLPSGKNKWHHTGVSITNETIFPLLPMSHEPKDLLHGFYICTSIYRLVKLKNNIYPGPQLLPFLDSVRQ